VKQEVITVLEQMGPEDRVALNAPGCEVHVLHDFTSSQERLLPSSIGVPGERAPIGLETPKADLPVPHRRVRRVLKGMPDRIWDLPHPGRLVREVRAPEAAQHGARPGFDTQYAVAKTVAPAQVMVLDQARGRIGPPRFLPN
jgi:hypothetical protein